MQRVQGRTGSTSRAARGSASRTTAGTRSSPKASSVATLVALGAVLMFFWDSPVVWPLKILVVLFHELGHAAAALLTGGSVVSIGLEPNQGGVTHTRGGFGLLVLNAGYLGSLLAGTALLYASRTPRTARRAVAFLVTLLALTTFLWVRPIVSFGFLFSAVATVAVAALARWGNESITQSILRGLGVFSVLYALWDVRVDILAGHPGGVSDATMLAELTWIPAPIWGIGWLIAGIVLLWSLRRWLV